MKSLDQLNRFIPAPAGNSCSDCHEAIRDPVHPRACGETVPPHEGDLHSGRFIPAPAGNSTKARAIAWAFSVHPRACGEQVSKRTESRRVHGSSPRLRGTANTSPRLPRTYRFIPAPAGNSPPEDTEADYQPVHPRACGEQLGFGGEKATPVRFIPAPAGNSQSDKSTSTVSGVHPRACGEQLNNQPIPHPNIGSSPRLRGTAECGTGLPEPRRFIPAPAGNRGPTRGWQSRTDVGSSPRLRGTVVRGDGQSWQSICRFIPAPAGNSCNKLLSQSWENGTVHPRACGEQCQRCTGPRVARTAGSSPRLRGTERLEALCPNA